jgi:hypothetical protein
MRAYILAAALLVSLGSVAAIAAPAYTISDTDIGTLLDDPQARAILDKHIPGFSKREQIEQARPFTMNFIKNFPQADISDEMLKGIQADFDQLAKSGK